MGANLHLKKKTFKVGKWILPLSQSNVLNGFACSFTNKLMTILNERHIEFRCCQFCYYTDTALLQTKHICGKLNANQTFEIGFAHSKKSEVKDIDRFEY